MVFSCNDCCRSISGFDARCPKCGGVISYENVEATTLSNAISGNPWTATPAVERRISMGEGETSLIKLEAVSNRLSVDVYAKLESLNPTCSFKDRGSSLLVSVVADSATSYEGVVVASTGNTASSVAAYAARADIPCAVLLPDNTGSAKVAQAAEHGVEVFSVDGSFSDCFELAQSVAGDRILNATAVYSANPLVKTANRTVAFELAAAMNMAPDWISVPVGAGPLLGGIHSGFQELTDANLIDRLPRQLCVQARGCHPIVDAFEHNRQVEAWDGPITTDIGAIADPLQGYAADGEHTRQAVLDSNGTAIALSDETVFEWQHRLAELEGIYAEPASAASIAALAESTAVRKDETAVALVTGHGLKEPAEAAESPVQSASEGAVRETLLS
jgi:threonine synthase